MRQARFAKDNQAFGYVEKLLKHLSSKHFRNSCWFEVGLARGLFVADSSSRCEQDASMLKLMLQSAAAR